MTDSKAGLSSSSTRIVRVMAGVIAGVIVAVVALSYRHHWDGSRTANKH